MVEHVEKLSAELRPQSLMDRCALGQSKIQFRKPRARERIPADVAERPRNRRTERSRIEPLLHRLTVERPTKARSPVGAHRIPRVPVARRVIAELWREGKSALQRSNATQRPSSDHLLRHSGLPADPG